MTKILKNSLQSGVAFVTMCLFACSDDDNFSPNLPSLQELGRYEFSLRDSQDSLVVNLAGITEDVTGIESSLDWLNISAIGKTENGEAMLRILRQKETPARFESDSAYVYFTDDKRATVVITADGLIRPLGDNTGEYEKFNKRWWEEQEILYTVTRTVNKEIETISQHIPLPWAPAATSNIPSRLFEADGLTADEGWVMAYNLFAAEANGNPNSKPYFMLYNKYTGILRTFYYQNENSGSGGEFSFVVTPGSSTSPKIPYYHSLQYGIPVSNKNVQMEGNVLHLTKGDNTFQQNISPYLKADIVLKPGWYCFDMDLGVYDPTLTVPFRQTDRMSIDCVTAMNTNITLAGTLAGSSNGSLEAMSNSSTSTANGMNYLDQFKSGTSNASEALSAFMQGNYLMGIMKGGMALWNMGKAVSGNATDDYTTETKTTGTINMSFTGNLDLKGYATSSTTNNAIGVEFAYSSFAQNDKVGYGVWSLQNNPVVYVVNDRLIGEDEDLACVVESNSYSTGTQDPSVNNLRLMTFFDPTSIKINLNTANFKNISNVEMTWLYGVYPNQPAGHTDAYRNGMMNFKGNGWLATPEFIDKAAYEGEVYKSFSSDFAKMNYVEWPIAKMTTTSLDASTKAGWYAQKGADYRYYGNPANDQKDDNLFVVDPIICLPTTYASKEADGQKLGKFYDFPTPDLVVGVVINIQYTMENGEPGTAVLSKRFLPQIRAISSEELKKKREELQKYVDSGVHQTLDGNITIHHKEARTMLKQFFSTADYLDKYEFE